MKNKLKFSFIFFYFIFSTISYSQNDKEKILLSELLVKLQQQYDYHFAYADDVLNNLKVDQPPDDFTFIQIIEFLQRQTGLIFKINEKKYITINKESETKFACGYVIDNESKMPLSGVDVLTNNNHTITDAYGYFKLKIDYLKEPISFRYMGFYTISDKTSSFSTGNCTNIYMTPRTEILSEIVLNSYITKGINKIIDGSFNIDFKSFDILPGLIEPDILQTVQALPGIQSVNETVSNINIRGGTHDQNLILWDGIKMYQSGHFFGLISMFNPLIISDVSLIKNGTNVDMSDGVSGTLDMHSDKTINKTFKSSVGINFINADIFSDIPLGKKSSVQISGRKSIHNIAQTPTYNKFYDRLLQDTQLNTTNAQNKSFNTFDFYDVSTRWIYDISSKDRLQANLLIAGNKLDAEGDTKESDLEQKSIAIGLNYQRNCNKKLLSELQIYETDYRLKSINSNNELESNTQQENNVSETSVKFNTWYKRNTQLTFLNGYQFTETGITNLLEVDNPSYINKATFVTREHALYTQANYTFNSDNTTLKVGIRYNYIEKFKKSIIEPRFSINQKINDKISIEILGEYKHQNTTQIINSQTDFLGIEKRRWFLSNNTNIPIIKSKQASLGLNYTKEGWLVSIDGFIKEVNGITTLSQGFLNQYEKTEETGLYKVFGADFLVNKKINKFSTWFSYSYANNRYTFKDLSEVTFPNNLDIRHIITFGSSFSAHNIKLSAGINWHTGIPTTMPVANNELYVNEADTTLVNFQNANSNRLKDYIRVDVSAVYNFKITKKIKAHAGISVWNVLNHKNIINNYYKVGDNTANEVVKQALLFTPNLTFRVLF